MSTLAAAVESMALPQRWLVTGVAGFIGSHLLQALLGAGCSVVGLDNFSAGTEANLDDVKTHVTAERWNRFRLITGDIRDEATCLRATADIDVISHQAALNSVSRSIDQPNEVLDVNTIGTVTVLRAAVANGVGRCVYASSSSVYGDVTEAVRCEAILGAPLSPYAVSKRSGEYLAQIYQRAGGLEAVGLRYFNVFGPRQNPDGPYAAVIPRWISLLLGGNAPEIHGTGRQSRDFTYVDNVVLANMLAASRPLTTAAVNIGTGTGTPILALYSLIREQMAHRTGCAHLMDIEPQMTPPRAGDVADATADLELAQQALGYRPLVTLAEGLPDTIDWFAHRSPLGGP